MRAGKKPCLHISTILITLLILFEFPVPIFASEGGGYTLTKHVMANYGETAKTSGEYDVSSALSQEGVIGAVSGGQYSAGLGFYGVGGSGIRLRILNVFSHAIGPKVAEIELGTPRNSKLWVVLEGDAIPETFISALAIAAIRDKDGNIIHQPQPVNFSYDAGSKTIEVWPASGTWRGNTVYELIISTSMTDYQGLPLEQSLTTKFCTMLNYTQDNTVVDFGEEKAMVSIPAGALNRDAYIVFNNNPIQFPHRVLSNVILEATRKLKHNRGKFYIPHVYAEINAYDSESKPITESFNKPSFLTMSYSDSDGDGLIDSQTPPLRERTNSIYRLDEKKALWVRLPGSRIDMSANNVRASAPHFSVFSVVASADYSVHEVFAYPVPFRPYGPNAGAGVGQTGTDAEGITFSNIPSETKIKVFNIRGELVWDGEDNDGDGECNWNVRNKSGVPVASGVYFYLVKSAHDSKAGKLVIIR